MKWTYWQEVKWKWNSLYCPQETVMLGGWLIFWPLILLDMFVGSFWRRK